MKNQPIASHDGLGDHRIARARLFNRAIQAMMKRLSGNARLLCALLISLVALPSVAAETLTYYYTSPQGTVLATADAAGVVLSIADYRPYGAQALGSPAPGPGYTGHVNDSDSGLVYMQQRYYDPSVGRFLSVDPVEPEQADVFSFNRFVYAKSNPIANVDPDGRESACVLTAKHCAGDPQSAVDATMSAYQVGVGVGKALVNGAMELDASLQSGTQETPNFEASNAEQAGGMLIGTVAVEAAKSVPTEGRSAEASAVKLEDRLTYLYQKLDAAGNHMKFGVTWNPPPGATLLQGSMEAG